MNGIFGAFFLPEIPNLRIHMFEACKFPVKREDYVNKNEEVKGLFILAHSYKAKYRLKNQFLDRYLQGFVYKLFIVKVSINYFYFSDDPEKVAFAGALVGGIKCFYMTGIKNSYIPENRILCFSFLQEIGTNAEFNVSSIVIEDDSSDEETFKAALLKVPTYKSIYFSYIVISLISA